MKRLIDVGAAIFFVLTYPLQIFFVNKPIRFFLNCLHVISGKKTWVGYSKTSASLPRLRSGVLAPNGRKEEKTTTVENRQLLDYWYARNYEPLQDVKTIFRYHANLGG